ncbi:MAG: Hsp20 family protein [Bacteroidota bacterium]
MKYGKGKNWVRRMLKTADVMNTVNGGMVEPYLSFERKSDHYLLKARVPGVDADALGVEMIESDLILHHQLDFDDASGSSMTIPHVIATFPVQGYVDYENIVARYEDGVLQVTLPFNELSSGYHKKIEIER